MSTAFSVLALGTRKDAETFEQGCKSLGMKQGVVVRNPRPSPKDMSRVFNTSADWLYVGGHSQIKKNKGVLVYNDLFNEGDDSKSPEGAVVVQLLPSKLQAIRYQVVNGKVAPVADEWVAKGFPLANVKVSLWGGCEILRWEGGVRYIQAMFGKHTILGFEKVTGAEVVRQVLAPDEGDFFVRIVEDPSSAGKVITAWFDAAVAAHKNAATVNKLGFAAIEPNGTKWVLSPTGRRKRGAYQK